MIRRRQLFAFAIAGAASAVVHYGVLVALVQMARWQPVTATLCGYVAGGFVSYLLNRRLTFVSRRDHRAALPRFVAVAGVGFALTGLIMAVLTGLPGVPYLPAQVVTTGVVLVWSFIAHKIWTFDDAPLL